MAISGSRHVPPLGANGSPKVIAFELSTDSASIEVQHHPGPLHIDPRLDGSAPAVLQVSLKLTVLDCNVQGSALKERDSVRLILPGSDDTLSFRDNFFG